jgi:Lipopolysaccharide export system permease LptF/LptG
MGLKHLFLSITCLSLLLSSVSCASNKAIEVTATSPQKSLAPQKADTFDIIVPIYSKVESSQEIASTNLSNLIYARRWDGLRMYDVTIVEFSQDKLTQFIVSKEMLWDSQQRTWIVSDGQKYTLALNGSYSNIAKLSKHKLRLAFTPSQLLDFHPNDVEFPEVLLPEYRQVKRSDGDVDKQMHRIFSAQATNQQKSQLKRIVALDIGEPSQIQVTSVETAEFDRQKNSWHSNNGYIYTIFPDGSPPSILKFDRQIIRMPRLAS